MAETARDICENCRFWDNSTRSLAEDVETGACRVRAPRINKITGLAAWPITEDTDWCGEFASPSSEEG